MADAEQRRRRSIPLIAGIVSTLLLASLMLVAAIVSGFTAGFLPNALLNMGSTLFGLLFLLVFFAPVLRALDRRWDASMEQERLRLLSRLVGASTPEVGEESSTSTSFGYLYDDSTAEREARYALLLFESQAYGLVLLRRNALASLALSVLGALVLVGGIATAFVRAWNGGSTTATVATTTAGVLTTGLGALMHRQANRALKHLEDQSEALRGDLRADSDRRAAAAALAQIEDTRLRDQVQAAIALKLLNADLSVFGCWPVVPAQGDLQAGEL